MDTDQHRSEKPTDELRISGEQARLIIQNCHSLLRTKFKGTPLWSMVGSITGHGSGYSIKICESANLDPFQKCEAKKLQDWKQLTTDH